MERLGIDPGEGAVPRLSLSYVTAFHRCEACGDKQACREWLDSMPRSVVSAPRFCPNADILFELAVNQPRLNPVVSPRDHAHIADLERLEDEIDDLLVQKPTDDPMIVELKGRKLRLQCKSNGFATKPSQIGFRIDDSMTAPSEKLRLKSRGSILS